MGTSNEQLPTVEEIVEMLNKNYNHTNYFHYTMMESASRILCNSSFLLNRIDNCNDKIECEQYKDKPIYILCFSTGISEIIPNWYLYSGIDGKGCRIGIKKKNIVDFIKKSRFSLVKMNNIANEEVQELDSSNSIILFKDVLYFDNNSNLAKYNGKTIYLKNDESFKLNLINSFEYRLKTSPWYYEKETRIIVELKEVLYNKIKKDREHVYRVKMEFSKELMSEMNLTLGPEFDKNKILELLELEGFKKFVSLKLYPSTMSEKIKMDLIERNKAIINNINKK